MTAQKTAAIVLIGEELLSGKIDDLNGAYAIGHLRRLGVNLRELRIIGDDIEVIGDVVAHLASQYDIVFTSGGVGPTHDDLTMRGLAHGFQAPLETHKEMEALIEARFNASGDQLRVWKRMAQLPRGCAVVLAEETRVPIFKMQNVWVLPGVPELFRLQFDQIAREIDGTPVSIRTLFVSVGEGDIAEHLEATLVSFPDVKLGSYPVLHADDHRTRITIESIDHDVVEGALSMLQARLHRDWIVRVGDNYRIGDA